jgi:DNA topoisomerase VI subunit B
LLGAIGHAHLHAHIKAAGAAEESIEYKSAAFSHDGIPYLVEAAFGYCPKGQEKRSSVKRKIITGINNSVAIGDPFRDISDNDEYEQSLGEVLTDLRAGQQEPIVFVLHLVCPRIDYLDRGKSAVALPDMPRREIIRLVAEVTKSWTKQRKAEERDRSAPSIAAPTRCSAASI